MRRSIVQSLALLACFLGLHARPASAWGQDTQPAIAAERPTPLAPSTAPSTEVPTLGPERRPLIPVSNTGSAPVSRADASTGDNPGLFSGLGGIVAPLSIVLGAILIIATVFRKAVGRSSGLAAALAGGAGAPSGVLEVLGRFPVARGQSLVLLKLDQRVLLLSHAHGAWRGRGAAGGFTTLSEITDPTEVASILLKTRDDRGESAARTFGSLMQRFAGEGRTLVDDEPEIGRRTRETLHGDRTELWDDSAIAPTNIASAASRPAAAPNPVRPDAVTTLRQRLALIAPARQQGEGSAA